MNLNISLSNVFFSVLMQVGIISLFAIGSFAQPPVQPWSSETSLATNPNQAGYVGIAGSGEIVHAVYSGFEPTTILNQPPIHSTNPIMYRRSADQGASFDTAIQIGRGPLGTDEGAVGALFLEDTVMADGELVAVCYYNNFQAIDDFPPLTRSAGDIYIVVSGNGGTDFLTQTPVRLNTGATGFALRHSIAIKDKNIHVVWMDFRILDGVQRWNIYYRRSTDAGENWDDEKLLVSGINNPPGRFGSGAQRPQIAANGDTIHVSWMDGRDNNAECMIEGGVITLPQCTEIYYTKSTNNGDSFLETPTEMIPLTRLTTSTTTPPTYSGRPDVVTDGSNTVYVLYDKRTPGVFNSENDIFFMKSANGNPFESPVQITNAAGISTHSSGIAVGPILWTIWIDTNPNLSDYKVYSIAYSGTTFNDEQLVSSSTVNAGAPVLGASKNYIHAIWVNFSNINMPTISYSRRSSSFF